MVCARPPPSSTQALPPGPNPDALTLPAATGADTVQRVPSDQAASRLVPASSSAAGPSAVSVSPSTCTWSPPSPAGSGGPAACHVPPTSAKTPATPRRTQLPAAIGTLLRPNETALTATRPQPRPGADAASVRRLASCDQRPALAAAAFGAVWMLPLPSRASA